MFEDEAMAADMWDDDPAWFGPPGPDPDTGEWPDDDTCQAFDDIDPADRAWLLSLDHDDPTTTTATAGGDGEPAAGSLTAPTHENPPAAPVEAVATGPELAALLAGVDLTEASAYDVVEAAAGWARLAAWVTAQQAATLAELSTRPELQPGACGYRSVNPVTNTALEIAARTVTTTRQAENLVGHAVQLVHDFPSTHHALETGLIDERRAKVITDELGGHDPAIRARVEEAVLPDAPTMDTVVLRRRVKELLHQLAPVQTEQRCQAVRDRRYVTHTPAPDGMAYLEAFLPAEDAAAVKATLDAAADTMKRRDAQAGREPRTAAQRRADALAAMAWTALRSSRIGGQPGNPSGSPAHDGDGGGHAPVDGDAASDGAAFGIPLATAQGHPVTVHLTFAFSSLIGQDDHPGHLDGYGPIPAPIARHLAAAGLWQWVGAHPATGQLLDYGLSKYRPPQALIDYVVMRDRTCRTPGCHRPAIRCDIDHRVAHAGGGPTSACNCQPLCKTHHLLKHRGGWKLGRTPTGATTWTSPTGHTYLKPPEPIAPVTSSNAPPGSADDHPDNDTPPF